MSPPDTAAAAPLVAPPSSLPRTPPIWLLVLITFSGTLAMHIFVPALPHAAADLGAGIPEMQLTVSLYILGLALGQLIYGPVSDRWGRRPTLIAGLILYTGAGLFAALAPNAHALIAARLFQALGGCAGLVLGRAIVRDTSEPEHAARRLATMNLMMSVGPGLAPLVGGWVATHWSWRAVLFLLCAMGSFNLLASWLKLTETRPPGPTMPLATLKDHYASLLRSRPFLGFSLAGACATTPSLAFIATAPFIFVGQFHRALDEVGLYLMFLIAGVSLGSMLTTRLIGKITLRRLFVLSNGAGLLTVASLLALQWLGMLTLPLLLGGMFVYTMGVGMASPACMTLALGVNRQVVGTASGLYGFVQMLLGAVVTAAVGLGSQPTTMALGLLVLAGIVGQSAFALTRGSGASPLPTLSPGSGLVD